MRGPIISCRRPFVRELTRGPLRRLARLCKMGSSRGRRTCLSNFFDWSTRRSLIWRVKQMDKAMRLILLFWLFSALIGTVQAQGQSCTVTIVAPSAEDKVAEMDQVKGTGTIPADTYLWVFAHRKGLALWWPQGGGPAVITKGTWEVTATFGLERDNGRQFEIAAAVVDRNTNEKLMNWVNKASETGQYPGMNFPSTV